MASPSPSAASAYFDGDEDMSTVLPGRDHTPTKAIGDSDSNLMIKEKTPTSLVLKLKLPPQRLRELVNFDAGSISMSVHSSPPPSSPIASTTAAETSSKAASKRRSGPKPKKTKIVIGEDGKPVEILAVNLSGPRLGPKSNAGAINENLRNLDRSGKPCRRWHKKAISVRSLYGTKWKTPSWIGDADTT